MERGLRKSTLTKTCCAKVGRGAFQQYTQNLHIHQHTHKNTHTQTHTHTQIHTSTPQHTHTQEPTQHTDFESEKHSSAHRCWGPAHECSRPPPPQPTQSQRGARQQQALGPVCHTVEAQNSQPRWLCLRGKCPCLPQSKHRILSHVGYAYEECAPVCHSRSTEFSATLVMLTRKVPLFATGGTKG